MPIQTTATIDQTTVDAFASHLHRWGRTSSTVRAYVSDLQALLADEPSLTPLTFSDAAAAWLTRKRPEWAASTINRRLASFNQFAKWLGVDGLDDYRRSSAQARPKNGINIDAIFDVLDRMPFLELPDEERRNAHAMIALCGLGGLRINEAVSINHRSFGTADPDTVPMYVRGKGNKERIVPFPTPQWLDLCTYGGADLHTVTSVRTARWLIEKVFTLCGYERVQSHQLRHAFATATYNASGDVVAVQKLLGHANLSTTQKYIETAYSARASIVASLSNGRK
jgi:site-specific recombinase XerD